MRKNIFLALSSVPFFLKTSVANVTSTETPTAPKVYKISTLNHAPKRCLQIEEKEEIVKGVACLNFPNWSDGVNGCVGYENHRSWCDEFGAYSQTEFDANHACCVCGGGHQNQVLRFGVGDVVKLKKLHPSCRGKVVEIQPKLGHTYKVELLNDCGDQFIQFHLGDFETIYEYNAGDKINLKGDSARDISEFTEDAINLRKCRPGVKEQEFFLIPHGADNQFIVKHALTDTNIIVSASNKVSAKKLSEGSFVVIDSVFKDDGTKFDGSDDYVFIKYGKYAMNSGKFGQPDFAKADWMIFDEGSNQDQPYLMWSFEEVSPNTGEEIIDEHGDWLVEKVRSGGIEHLKQLAPWYLLDVDREASKKEVKSRFRELSRRFHPDKKGGPLFEEVFVLLQNAYDGLKKSDEKEKEKFRTTAETEQQLFAHSNDVTELLPSHWRKINSGDKEKYVLATRMSDGDNEEFIGEETFLSQDNADDNTAQVWLLFIYSPRCGMSRTVVTFVELAARHLAANENVKVGAYGCGIYGDSLNKSKQQGFRAWQSDPICKQFGREETPNTHVVVEALNGTREFWDRTSRFTTFYSAAAIGGTKELWPHNLIEFATISKNAWEDSSLVETFDKSDFDSPTFNQTIRIIAFVTDHDEDVQEVQNAILTSLPSVAKRLLEGHVRVGVASCAREIDEDGIDCSQHGVSFLPDIKIFAADQTKGISLVNDDYGERRDAQIALEVLVNTLTAVFDLEEGDSILDDEDLIVEDEEPTCEMPSGGGSVMYEENQNQKKLNEKKTAKLAQRTKDKSIPIRDTRKSANRAGGGTLYGGGSGGSMGAIGGF